MSTLTVKLLIGHLAESLQHLPFFPEAGPEKGVTGQHTIEGVDASISVLIGQLNLDANRWIFAILYDPVSELGMVGTDHLVDVHQNHFIFQDHIGQIPKVLQGTVVANIAADDGTLFQSYGKTEIVVLQKALLQGADSNQSVEAALFNTFGIKGFLYPDTVPVIGAVAVFHQNLYLPGCQGTVEFPLKRPVTQVVLIFSRGKKISGNKSNTKGAVVSFSYHAMILHSRRPAGKKGVEPMAKKRTIFLCSECGRQEAKWMGRCPDCGAWNSFHEQDGGVAGGTATKARKQAPLQVQELRRVEVESGNRFASGIEELDRVLGGGIMRGSAVLIGGEPGIGKSTLMMQLAASVAEGEGELLYVSGEESASQIKMRAQRLGFDASPMKLFCESDLDRILAMLRKLKPKLLIIDSIQTLISRDAGQIPGTVNQLKYACHELIDWARESDSALFLIAHVTKEGSIAGPKIIEHMVDTVLSFDHAEGGLRIVRATKNRFGSVDELGLFSMDAAGLHQVIDPGALFLIRRGGTMPPGIAAVPVYEGSRVLMVELQALTVPAKGAYSRVYSERIDPGRVNRLAAVLERHLSLRFTDQDIYVNVAGGMRIGEVGVELGLAMALYSARTGMPLPKELTMAGELSLAGEIRPTAHLQRRMKSAAELGFERFIGPGEADNDIPGLIQVKDLSTAVKAVFDGSSAKKEG